MPIQMITDPALMHFCQKNIFSMTTAQVSISNPSLAYLMEITFRKQLAPKACFARLFCQTPSDPVLTQAALMHRHKVITISQRLLLCSHPKQPTAESAARAGAYAWGVQVCVNWTIKH